MRRNYDTINPRTHPLTSPGVETYTHPFWHASVIGVFHADVQHTGPHSHDFKPKRMKFSWVGVVPASARSFGKKHHYDYIIFAPMGSSTKGLVYGSFRMSRNVTKLYFESLLANWVKHNNRN